MGVIGLSGPQRRGPGPRSVALPGWLPKPPTAPGLLPPNARVYNSVAALMLAASVGHGSTRACLWTATLWPRGPRRYL